MASKKFSLHREEDRDLQLDRRGAERGLLEEFDDARAAVELTLRLGVEVGTKLGEGREFAELRELALEFAADLLGGLDLRGRTDARDGKRPTETAGRMPWLKRSDSKKICPSVIEITRSSGCKRTRRRPASR